MPPKGQFHQFHKSRQLPRRLCPVANGSTIVYLSPKSVVGGFASVRSGIAHAPGRRLSESRVRENLMHGLMRQGVETRTENNPPQAPLPDPTSGPSARGCSPRPLNASDGADASRRAIGAADYHPLSVRRSAPAIKRLQRTVVHASLLARPPAADPQRR